ncbi:MAG: cysteine desulfurase family protein [Alphaproteobacteria bacterium]
MKKQIYLDYNASAPLRPHAKEAMLGVLSVKNGALNASSVHSFGREGRKIIEHARENVAKLVSADTNQVLFNSSATEGNNTVIRHFAENFPDDIILISAAEHPSILELAQIYKNIKIIPVDENGLVETTTLESALKDNKTSLVSCIWVNNETGSIQNVSDLCKKAHENGAFFHTDATQAVGRITTNTKENAIDFMTISSHKIGGPQGAGALILGLCGPTPTLLHGGGQEKSARAGTENIAAIAGFGAAAKEALEHLNHYQALGQWRDELECKIKNISPEAVIHCENANRVSNTCFFSLPNANAQTMLMAFDLEGIAISNGSACSSGTVKPSTTLKAMGTSETISNSALRISLGWASEKSDIDAFIKAWEKIYMRVKI